LKKLTISQVKKQFSKSERYIAFLMTSLPSCQAASILNPIDPVTKNRSEVLERTLDYLTSEGGLCLEFGVYRGDSLRISGLRHCGKSFVGFDSFEGFPADGRQDWQQDFLVNEMPKLPNNCNLIKGWFSETLPIFLKNNQEPIDFINIDCDIYSSTADVFLALEAAKRLRVGQIIYFDEILNYSEYLWNESMALFEMLERTGLGIEWIASHQKVRFIDETIGLLNVRKHPTWEDDLRTRYRQQASIKLIGDGNIYGPLQYDHFSKKVKSLASIFERLSQKYSQGILFVQ